MPTVMMAVEGVLGEPDEFDVTMLPTPHGVGLYTALSQVYRIVLVTSEPVAERVDWWLAQHGLREYAQVLCSLLRAPGTPAEEREAQLRALRASRTDVAFVVDADPQVVVNAMAVGVPGLLYGRPRPPAGRRDLGARRIRDWSEVEAEFASHASMREDTS